MKKLFAFLVLAGLLCMFSFAMAELGTGKLYVGGKDIVAEGGTVAGGNGKAVLSYKDGNPVLTLTNYTYQGAGKYDSAIRCRTFVPMTIVLTGDNVLTITDDNTDRIAVIDLFGSLVIDGTGSLEIEAGNIDGKAYAYSNGIEAGDITINGGKINVSGGSLTGGSGRQESIGIKGDNISVNGGEIHAAGGAIENENGDNSSCGISARVSFILNDGIVYADGGCITLSSVQYHESFGIYAGDGVLVNGGELYATGGKVIQGDDESDESVESYGLHSTSKNAFGEGIRRLDIRGYGEAICSAENVTSLSPLQLWRDDPEKETCDVIFYESSLWPASYKRIRIGEDDEPEEEDFSVPAATASLPKTGDGGNPALWLGMVLLGLLGAGVAVAKRH